MMKLSLNLITLLLASFLFSCESEQKNECDEDVDVFGDFYQSELIEASSENEGNVIHNLCSDLSFEAHFASCAAVTVDTSNGFPITLVVDYGTGCNNERGQKKYGKVIFTVYEDMNQEGAYFEITFDDFKIDEASITGKQKFENTGIGTEANKEVQVVSNITSSYPDGATRTHDYTRQRTQISGFETCDRSDDEYLVTGAGIVDYGDKKSVRVIREPLHIKSTCKYPVAGIIDVESQNLKGEVNYGDGACDKTATLKVAGFIKKTIDMDQDPCNQ